MFHINKGSAEDAYALSQIAATTFIESHGHSAEKKDIDHFITEKYSEAAFTAELLNQQNNYSLIYYKEKLAGFSNIIYNLAPVNSQANNIAKLERIYILKEFYDLKLGHELFNHNINLARQQQQEAVWLFVWKENERAIRFYKKKGFRVIGESDYRISETHSNPNYIMLLQLED